MSEIAMGLHVATDGVLKFQSCIGRTGEQ